MKFSIGNAARESGVKVTTIRYYENVGLMRNPDRNLSNQRLYLQSDVDRLAFIRHARELGFPLDAIRDLLSLSSDPEQPCDAVNEIARAQLLDITGRIAQLESLKDELENVVERCRGGRIADCRVIEVLGDHGLCQSDHKAVSQF